MNARQLIDILKGYDGDTEVELAVVAPVTDAGEPMEIDRFDIAGVLPWEEDDGELVLWLVSGEDSDVEAFLDWVEEENGEVDEEHVGVEAPTDEGEPEAG